MWRNEDQRNRVISALNTLVVLIGYRKWAEAIAVMEHEIKWYSDPIPDLPEYDGFKGWEVVHLALLQAQARG